jgi:putative toxin-antitoxin system antitoxin component (TIGR02293 family)
MSGSSGIGDFSYYSALENSDPRPIHRLQKATIVAIIGDIMVNELRAVVHELGGEQTLGRTLSTDRDLREAIREGFPPAVVQGLMRTSGLTLKELADALDLSSRSLQRRRRSGRLARHESDRLYRLARIVALANEYLGDHERAMRWLKHPNRALGGVAPVAAIDTEPGARQVENVLGRVAYGGVS